MTLNSVAAHTVASLLTLLSASTGQGPATQPLASVNAALPFSAELSDVEIRWQSGGGDGCAGVCTNYRITMRGDGVVTLEDLGWGERRPQAGLRTRDIGVEAFVATVNQLFKARFLEAPGDFANTRVARREGDMLNFYSSGGIGGGWVNLTLRAGSFTKTVRVGGENTPAELLQLTDLVWSIGGPNAWGPRQPSPPPH